MVEPAIDDLFLRDHRLLDVIAQPPPDSTTGSRVDEAVLRARVKGIASIHKFRMQDDVSLLLRRRLQIWKPLPLDQVARSNDPCLRDCRRGIGVVRILPLRAENTVNPSVLVRSEERRVGKEGGGGGRPS